MNYKITFYDGTELYVKSLREVEDRDNEIETIEEVGSWRR